MPRLRTVATTLCAATLPSLVVADEISVEKEAKELATVWNPSKCSVTLFGGDLDDPRYWHAVFPVGDYNMRDFERKGARNDQTSSIRVKGAGCEATVFGGNIDDQTAWQYTFKEGSYNFLDHAWSSRGVVNDDVSSLRVQSPDMCSATIFGGELDDAAAWTVHFKEGDYTKKEFKTMGAKSKEVASLRVFGYGCVAQVWASDLDDPSYWCESFPEGEYRQGEFFRRGGVEEAVSAIRVRHALSVDNSHCNPSGEEILASRRRREAAHSMFSFAMWACACAMVVMCVFKKLNNPGWTPMDLEHELNVGSRSGDGLVASMGGALGMRTVQRPDDGYWLG